MSYTQIKAVIGFLIISLLTACGSDSTTEDSTTEDSSFDVTVVDGYIKDATVTDSTGLIATYSENGTYTFDETPTYPITASGGQLEETDLDFDIEMSNSDETSTVISPITTFLGTDSTLLSQFAELDLGISTLEEFSVDYVSTNDSSLARLAQVLYLIETDSTLSTDFKESIQASSTLASLDDLITLAKTEIENASTLTTSQINQMASFLDAIAAYTGDATDIEDSLYAYKYNIVNNEETVITHDGLSYGLVLSPYTGKYWLDRNIGATQICESQTDSECYGGYFQWGRPADGHEDSDSATTTTLATSITDVGHGDFIIGSVDWTSADTTMANRSENWSVIDGSSVCPIGYRVPTINELTSETIDLSDDTVENTEDIFNGFLSVPSVGYRSGTGSFNETEITSLASVSLSTTYFQTLDLSSSSAEIYEDSYPQYGISVRCIQD